MKQQHTIIQYSQPGKKVVEVTVLPNGSCNIILETFTSLTEVTVLVNTQKVTLIHIKASELSMCDKFFHYHPRTAAEWIFKNRLIKYLKIGFRDFYIPKYVASSITNYPYIRFIPDGLPVLEESYDWWDKLANRFAPQYNTHLCTIPQYYALWAVLLKELVSSGWEVSDAWHAVCTDFTKLLNNPYATPENLWKEELFGLHNLFGYFKYLAYDPEIKTFGLAAGCFAGDSPVRLCFGLDPNCSSKAKGRDFKDPGSYGLIVFETISPLY